MRVRGKYLTQSKNEVIVVTSKSIIYFASSLVSSKMKEIMIKKVHADEKVVARRYVCIFDLSILVEERFGGNWGIHAFFIRICFIRISRLKIA